MCFYQKIDSLFSEEIKSILTNFSNRREIRASTRDRATCVLLASEGCSNVEIAKRINKHPDTVGRWKNRIIDGLELIQEYCGESHAELQSCLEDLLSDRHRSGRPRKYDDDVRSRVTGILCRSPQDFGYEVNKWTLPLLHKVVTDKNIATGISIGALYHIQNESQMKPWKNEYYLHCAEKYDNPDTYKDKIYTTNFAYLLGRVARSILGKPSPILEPTNPDLIALQKCKCEFWRIASECRISSKDIDCLWHNAKPKLLPANLLGLSKSEPSCIHHMSVPLLAWQKMKLAYRVEQLKETMFKATNSRVQLSSEVKNYVESPSFDAVRDIAAQFDIKDHLIKEDSDQKDEQEAITQKRLASACDLINKIKSLAEENSIALDIAVNCVDEKTGMQIIKLNQVKKDDASTLTDYKYERLGTISYIGFFDTILGQPILPAYLNRHYKENNFVDAVISMVNQRPYFTKMFLIADNYATHKSEGLVRLCSLLNGDKQDLGVKGKYGILKNKETRAAYLSDTKHRIVVLYQPKHCSWMNQIECFFGIMEKKFLKLNSFESIKDFVSRLTKFLKQHCALFARPFNWQCTGVPKGASIK